MQYVALDTVPKKINERLLDVTDTHTSATHNGERPRQPVTERK